MFTQQLQKTAFQSFKEWMTSATTAELEAELFDLDETNLSVLSQLEQYDLKVRTELPTQYGEEWRLRASHKQRWTYYQKSSIERRIVSLREIRKTEIKAANGLLNVEVAKAAKKRDPEAESRRLEHNRIAEESIRLKHQRTLTYDNIWIKAAVSVLDKETIKAIADLANRKQEELDNNA